MISHAEQGVLAYGKKPIPRAIPNQRFLQNTLKSVDFGESHSLSSSNTAGSALLLSFGQLLPSGQELIQSAFQVVFPWLS